MTFLNKLIKNFFTLSIFFGFVFLPNLVNAARLDFVPNNGTYNVGDTISVKVIVSSTDKSVNAVSSNLSFSRNNLSLTSISKTSSIISLWAQDPSFSNGAGTASLEGVVLNGYTGSFGTVATLNFKVTNPGNAYVSFSGASVLANDGLGTNVLSATNSATYTISENIKKEVPTSTTDSTLDKIKDLPAKKEKSNISIEEIRSSTGNKIQARFIITAPDKDSNAPYNIQIDSSDVYEWNDESGSHIYETIPLSYGPHLIKVTTKDVNGNTLSIYKNFAINGLSQPIVTEYPSILTIGDNFTIKGVADPNTNVIFSVKKIENGELLEINEGGSAVVDEDGVFSFTYPDSTTKGVYLITLKARNDSGLESEETKPIKINVKESNSTIWEKITTFLSVFIPAFGLVLVIVFILTYVLYRYHKYRLILKKDLLKTEALIKKSFGILEDDVKQEIEIFRKIKNHQTLTAKDKEFVANFKKDLEEAEGIIIKELKDVEKDVQF